ncbi:sensor histidine kinase [Desulfitobacterium sp.]|uniref:sensor histidine kinase n=1 Tax=Desulfitobacterium sp. TaxID=49981 RepID=UPI002D0102D2|nr:ATP-binding protein [Desulfitobacterium sp.]HVJ50804.1 ATP-binding protein [Desulfitobacterium sp.]
MTLRRKFLMALVGLVCLMAIVFAGIALSSVQYLLGHAVSYVQQGFSQQWNRTLTTYYIEHQSWEGVQDHLSKILENTPRPDVAAPRGNEQFYIFDANRTIVASSKPQDLGKNLGQIPHDNKLTQEWSEIIVSGKTVGYFWVDDKAPPRQDRLAQTIGVSIIRSMLIGLILTTLLALILGSILTGRITGPLKDLTSAVRRVAKGDLKAHLEVQGRDDIAMLGHAFNQMTVQLARNEEVRRNMVADIAHELRTPLAVISGKLELLQEGVLPLAPETLLPIQDETIRLSRLVQDLQQLSLAEAGKLPLHRMPMDISKLLGRIFEQFAFEFEERGIQGELFSESRMIKADSDRLTQVFVNLIGNALIHTTVGGKIKVSVDSWEPKVSPGKDGKKTGGRIARLATGGDPSEHLEKNKEKQTEWIRISVEDTGEGIPPEELDHVFDRFYRVDQSRDRETGGTGLGLAIAKEYVQAHGGEIQVESQLGSGTCFRVFLPIDFEKDKGDEEIRYEN